MVLNRGVGRPSRCLQPDQDSIWRAALQFRRGASRYASLADLYCAFAMPFLRRCYDQTLRPRRYLSKFSNSFCRHAGTYVSLDPHLGWQAAESYVERSDVFALIPGHRVLANCPVRALPSSVMNPRRFIRSPRRRWRAASVEFRRPSALAVLRLTINSNLVDCSTGRSVGVVPRRIR